MSKLKEWCREAFYAGTESESVSGVEWSTCDGGHPGHPPAVMAAIVAFESWWSSKNGDPDDEADKKTREQATRVRLRLSDLERNVEAIAGLIDDAESGLAACLAGPVIFGGKAQRDGAIAAARAQLAKSGDPALLADGDYLARIVLELLGERLQ